MRDWIGLLGGWGIVNIINIWAIEITEEYVIWQLCILLLWLVIGAFQEPPSLRLIRRTK